MCFIERGIFIFDLGILKEKENLIFLNRDSDILGNINYTQYCICKKNKKLFLKFEKRTVTKQTYKSIFTIESIQTIKNSSTGKIVLPNFISEGDILMGTYIEGFSFKFEDIFSIYMIKEADTNNESIKEKN